MMYTITFNGMTALENKIHVTERPDIPAPEEDITQTEIPGRDGVLIERSGRLKPITIQVKMAFSSGPDEWGEAFRKAKAWLLSGSGDLIFSDDEDYYYRVLYCTISSSTRSIKRLGSFTANFVCDPYMYLVSGLEEYDYSDVLENDYETSHPIYIISGIGDCTLTVNDNEMSAYVTNDLYIDTDLKIAYTTDREISNTAVTGDYEDLYLLEGENTISITDGYDLSVIPNWRCR